IAEPIAGATLGAAVPPDGYWPAIAEVCRRHGVLLIADEVMTGFGRTGTWFGLDHWGVRADIVVAGKGCWGGYWRLGLCVAGVRRGGGVGVRGATGWWVSSRVHVLPPCGGGRRRPGGPAPAAGG